MCTEDVHAEIMEESRHSPMPKLPPPERGEPEGPERSISGPKEGAAREGCSACDTESAEQSGFGQRGIVRCRQCDRLLFEPGKSAFSRVRAQKDVRTKTGPIDIEEQLYYERANHNWRSDTRCALQRAVDGAREG